MKSAIIYFLISTSILAQTNTVGCGYRVSDMYGLSAINNGNEYVVLSKTTNTPSWGVYYNMIAFYDNIDIAKSKNMYKEPTVSDEFIATSFAVSDSSVTVKDANNNTITAPIFNTSKDANGKLKSLKAILNSVNSLSFNGKKLGEDKIVKYYNDNFDGKLDPLKEYQEGVTIECDFTSSPKCALSLVKAYTSTVTF